MTMYRTLLVLFLLINNKQRGRASMQMFRNSVTLLIGVTISMAFTSISHSAPTQMKKIPAERHTTNFLVGKKPTLAPFAHVRFCARNPSDCTLATSINSTYTDSKRDMSSLSTINGRVNSQITPRNDDDLNGDVWDVDVTSGDCEDFALTKRRALLNAGWPSAVLRIAIALTSSGEGHAVLIVTTDAGDVVLDNRTNRIKPWSKSGLRFVKIQSAENPKVWQSI
jgi:predicted transglutaminase-like cysteine proteinase